MNHIDKTIDLFVEKINAKEMETIVDDVPVFLRDGECDENALFIKWKIRKRDLLSRITEVEKRLPKIYPPSYHSLVSRYAFPAFEIGPIILLANTGEDVYWEGMTKIFEDEFMSSFLFQNGFIQFGNPHFGDYDAICFDTNRPRGQEYPIVQIDHEAILCDSEIQVVKEISSSFFDFANDFINGRLK
jgi:hypothetical protein